MSIVKKAQKTAMTTLCRCLNQKTDRLFFESLRHLSLSEWEALLQLASEHGVAPLLYYHIKLHVGKTAIPEKILRRLHTLYMMNAGRNMRLYHELASLLTTLQEAEIPVILLKGAHLAELVYENIALRPMIDIDIFIKNDDIGRLGKCLREAGYTPRRPYWLEAERDSACHLPPFQKKGSIGIECHWALCKPQAPFSPDIQGCWERAQPAVIAQHETLVLSPEDLLLHLSLHLAFQHRFNFGLKALYDIFAVLNHSGQEVNWARLEERATQWKTRKSLYLSLFWAQKYLQAEIPEQALQHLRPDDITARVFAWSREQIFSQEANALPTTQNLIQAIKSTHWKERLKILFRHTFPSPSQMARNYPVPPGSFRLYLFYPVRVVELLRRYGKVVWKYLKHDTATLAALKREERGNALTDWLQR